MPPKNIWSANVANCKSDSVPETEPAYVTTRDAENLIGQLLFGGRVSRVYGSTVDIFSDPGRTSLHLRRKHIARFRVFANDSN